MAHQLHFSPQLFDITTQEAFLFPKELMSTWLASSQTDTDARALLAEYKVTGTVVVSDASGLSKLSQSMDLIDVLALLHLPKKDVFLRGIALGGEAIGSWAADNTVMYYPETTPTESIIEMLTSYQRAHASYPVAFGFGVLQGEFYKIGNVLVGENYHRCEETSENEVNGGEVWIHHEKADQIPATLMPTSHPDWYSVALDLHEKEEDHASFSSLSRYPHAFDDQFYDLLDAYATSKELATKTQLEKMYIKQGIVIFLARERMVEGEPYARMLTDIILDALLKTEMQQLCESKGATYIKAGGGIGIAVHTDPLSAYQLGCEIVMTMKDKHSIQAKCGIDQGSMMVFVQAQGTKDIAGEPVNIASKLSEDVGVWGSVLISDRVEGLPTLSDATRETFSVSKVELTAYKSILYTHA